MFCSSDVSLVLQTTITKKRRIVMYETFQFFREMLLLFFDQICGQCFFEQFKYGRHQFTTGTEQVKWRVGNTIKIQVNIRTAMQMHRCSVGNVSL